MNNNQVFSRIGFQKISPSYLHSLAVVPQALDNQWIPTTLLKSIIAKKQNYSDIEFPLKKRRRIEYLRSLIFAPQVVIHRAALLNNPAIYDDFTQSVSSRETFRTFIDTGVIVPFLLTESSPLEEPRFGFPDPKPFAEWQKIASETRMLCLRLSWDDDTNRSAVHNLILKRFEQSMLNLSMLNTEFLSELFNLNDKEIDLFNNRISEMSRFCQDTLKEGRPITRSGLYANFVVTPGLNSIDGNFYDVPFSYVIKQIIDANYNLAISSAVGRLSLVPSDTLPVTIPQKLDKRPEVQSSSLLSASDIEMMISPLLQEKVLHLPKLNFSSLENTDILAVYQIRQTSDWNYFIQKIQELLDNPFSLSMLTSGILNSYAEFSKVLSSLSRKSSQQTWQPSLEFRINIGSAIIRLFWHDGKQPILYVSGEIPHASKFAPVYLSLVINDEQNSDSDMSFGVTFVKAIMDEPGEQFDLLIGLLSKYAVQKETNRQSINKGLMLAPTVTPFSWESA